MAYELLRTGEPLLTGMASLAAFDQAVRRCGHGCRRDGGCDTRRSEAGDTAGGEPAGTLVSRLGNGATLARHWRANTALAGFNGMRGRRRRRHGHRHRPGRLAFARGANRRTADRLLRKRVERTDKHCLLFSLVNRLFHRRDNRWAEPRSGCAVTNFNNAASRLGTSPGGKNGGYTAENVTTRPAGGYL